MRIVKHMAWMIALSLWTGGALHAGPFVMPSEGPVPFRRDRVVLERHAMKELSRSLMYVAQGIDAEMPEQRRAMAQIFALAEALDPESESVSRMIEEIHKQKFRASVNVDTLEGRLKWIWSVVDWLEKPETGMDGQSLAGCLKDILLVVDSENSRVKELRQFGEMGSWQGWVEPISAYRQETRKERERIEEPPDEDLNLDSRDEPARIRMESASLPVMLWKPIGPEGKAYPEATVDELVMKAYLRGRPDPEEGGSEDYESFHVSIGSWGDAEELHEVAHLVEEHIQRRHAPLPEGLYIELRNPEMDASLKSGQRHAFTAVSIVLANMALTGMEHEGMILGIVNERGNFDAAMDIRAMIRSLGDREGLRLIVPDDAENEIMAFLAIEKPDFLIKNEIYSATTLDDVLELSLKKPSAALQGVREKFTEIRNKMGGQDIRTYVANSFIRQRLVSLYQEEPRHLSVKMLLLQASGKRPVYLEREVLASDLRSALLPMAWIFRRDYMGPDEEGLGDLYERCSRLAELPIRYADREDKDLVDRATQVLDAIRKLDRAIRSSRGEYWEKEMEIRDEKRELEQLAREFHEFVDQLLKARRERF